MSSTSFSQSMFTDLCERMLRRCALEPSESLVLLSQGEERAEYVDAFLAAGQRIGATVMHVRLPYSSSATSGEVGVWTVGKTPLAGNRVAIDALKNADMVVETLFLLFSDELTEIQSAGTRILTCIEPVDLLARMFPTEELARRTDVAVETLAAARTLRFTNRAGSDVTYKIGMYPTKGQYGYVDKPGQWDHWPSGGMVLTCGADDGIDGRVVVDRGDILLPFKQYVQDPIELVIEAGRIVHIGGDGFQAELMRGYLTDFDDPDAFGLSHIGWGLDERAKWASLGTDSRGHGMEPRAFSGNVLFSTGPNDLVGGPNHTSCHLDIPMRNCDLFLDDEPVIVAGEIVVDAMRPAEAAVAG
ncbi:MAG: 2,5-dihydroxypyridine 5,6-dioxygenase [Gaiellales bacterium]